MDKVERAKIIAVKMEEVLTEERTRELKEKFDIARAAAESAELMAAVKQYNANAKALETMRNNLETIVKKADERLRPKDGKRTMSISLNATRLGKHYNAQVVPVIYDNINGYTQTFTSTDIAPVQIAHGDVVAVLTRNRNTENPRIRKIVNEAFHLLLEDDAPRMQKFLNL